MTRRVVEKLCTKKFALIFWPLSREILENSGEIPNIQVKFWWNSRAPFGQLPFRTSQGLGFQNDSPQPKMLAEEMEGLTEELRKSEEHKQRHLEKKEQEVL